MKRTVPEYTTQRVSNRTSVPVSTLLSWERRHGFPCPIRNSQGDRLYSEHDIAHIEWLRDRTASGVNIRDAVAQLRTQISDSVSSSPLDSSTSLKDDVIFATRPNSILMDQERLAHDPQAGRVTTGTHDAAAMIAALRIFDERELSGHLSRLTLETSPAYVSQHFIPALIGEVANLVSLGNLDQSVLRFMDVTLARRMGVWLDSMNPLEATSITIIAGVAGETMESDILVAAISEVQRGFRVLLLGREVLLSDLVNVTLCTVASRIVLVAVGSAAVRSAETYAAHIGFTSLALAVAPEIAIHPGHCSNETSEDSVWQEQNILASRHVANPAK